MDETRHIELIRTDRQANEAYIACHSLDGCTNLSLPLDQFEVLVGQQFIDGEHNFLQFDVPRDGLFHIYCRGRT